MKKVIPAMVASLSLCPLFVAVSFADNPIVQTNYTADPAPIVYNDTVFLFTGHDEDGTYGWFKMKEWRCYSSTDMVNWTDRGSPMDLSVFSWANSDAWAGQVILRNSKFYYYVPVYNSTTGKRLIGVAVADKLTGPYKDPIDQPLISGSNDYIDPTVFIDDDGQAYLYWGNPIPYMVKLNEDMISYSGTVIKNPPETKETVNGVYLEGPWFYKRNDLYYFLFSGENNGREDIRYSTSSGPTGPWTYKGIIQPVQVGGKSWTNHCGVVDYKGNSYFFYHNGDLPGGSDFTRSACLEQFKYNTDGTIPTIPMTKEGPAQIDHLNPYDTTQAETICWSVGLKTGKCSEGGMNVDSIHNGDYIKVKGVDFGSGATSFNARVASGSTNGGSIELRLDTLTGPLAGTCSVQSTGGWQAWTTKSCTVTGANGVHDLYLKFTGSGRLFSFNWWKFTPAVGIEPTFGAKSSRDNLINLVSNAGKLRFDFSQTTLQSKATICLFDLTGRLVSSLFAGQLTATHLNIPLDLAKIRTGAYVVRITMDDEIVLTKTLSLQ